MIGKPTTTTNDNYYNTTTTTTTLEEFLVTLGQAQFLKVNIREVMELEFFKQDDLPVAQATVSHTKTVQTICTLVFNSVSIH